MDNTLTTVPAWEPLKEYPQVWVFPNGCSGRFFATSGSRNRKANGGLYCDPDPYSASIEGFAIVDFHLWLLDNGFSLIRQHEGMRFYKKAGD